MKPFMTRRPGCAVRRNRYLTVPRSFLVALALASSSSFAADCDIRASSSEVDYGEIHRGAVFPRADVAPGALGKKKIVLTAVCRQATTFTLRLEGPASPDGAFQFGRTGHFIATVKDATVDGNGVQLTSSGSTSGTSRGVSSRLSPTDAVMASAANGVPVKGKTFSASIEIDTYVGESDTRARDRMLVEGHGTLSVQTN
ncbi:hypothetical protein [Achromobacter xylosoxidans]|uniref:hypothetical protein n=1 Tax=Alcaligenes xylosoxydans xylosoxydans TaxID=85698 RepID=UPI0006C24190|nr:hypothetical protein [Achromobacter xylosoxidans]CUI38998.1 Uncharacterised protein [Achromobacter xylosoxidans]